MSRFCHNCGKELDDDEVFCAKCGTKNDMEENVPTTGLNPVKEKSFAEKINKVGTDLNKGVKKFRRIMFGISLVIVLIVGIASCFKGPMEVKSSDMIQDYIQDEKAAEKKYKNEDVKITGKVLEKHQFNNKDSFGLIIDYKESGDRIYVVVLDVPAKRVDIINKTEIGQFITLEGTCIGVVPQDNPNAVSIQIQADADKINK